MIDPLGNRTSAEQLRRLLLQEEQERLDHLEARLGDDDALRGSLAPIISDILRDAGVKDYKRMAGALAPVVLQSIKTEIHNSRDMMVDALYPITGRLVSAAVRNAFKDLVDQLNQKLDSSLSMDRWRARFKAKMTGRSEAEILLSEGAAFEITDLLLINRQTGFLIAQASSDSEQGGMDSQLLGSILTAIMAFVRDAMHESSEQDLRTLHVGDLRLHLQVSPGVILAIKTKGPPPAGFESALNQTFCDFLSEWGGKLSDPDETDQPDEGALASDLEDRFQSLLKAKQSNFRAPSKKGTILLSCLALIGIGWIAWVSYERWQRQSTESAAKTVIANMSGLVGYPFEVRYQDDTDTLRVAGLTPDNETLERLKDGLNEALPETNMMLDVQALPGATVDLSQVATQDDLLAAWDDISAIRKDLTRSTTVLGDEITKLIERRAEVLQTSIARIETELPSKVERDISSFGNWLSNQTVRFGNGSDFLNEAAAETLLQDVSARLRALPEKAGLLVVGYADQRGGERANETISLRRANIVSRRLLGLGIASQRLVAVGRGHENRISEETGPNSANRRVEFELITLQANGAPNAGAFNIDDDDVER
ncbi:MAG: OmpA family protein [Geminicoccaceae bacterium]